MKSPAASEGSAPTTTASPPAPRTVTVTAMPADSVEEGRPSVRRREAADAVEEKEEGRDCARPSDKESEARVVAADSGVASVGGGGGGGQTVTRRVRRWRWH